MKAFVCDMCGNVELLEETDRHVACMPVDMVEIVIRKSYAAEETYDLCSQCAQKLLNRIKKLKTREED